ncbi:MAG: PD-(D/E)XK nuclease family protein [Proteobacteria bacterium]|nr:PD-(D/E)XK nuclease family protein [Pseudomonadota bacterium]
MNLAFACALVGLTLAFLLAAVWRGSRVPAERASRPEALAEADLVYMERLFRIHQPIRLVAKVDRVYRLPGGSLVLVELKTRGQDRLYLTDIIQLSAQRLAIEIQTGAVVEPYAFVSVLRPNRKVRSHQVRLLDAAAVVSLYRRREAIVARRASPAYASTESACRNCVLRSRCDRFRR